jgi:HAD superfamily hydrolase (TIGR01509 family)
MSQTRSAVLVDVDGTLVDSNYFHTVAWWRAFQAAGESVAMSRIHPLIGMGSDMMLDALFGEQRPGMSDAHSREFKPFKRELRAFPEAGRFLAELSKRGARVVLATSSKESDLEEALEAIGAGDAVSEVVHGDMAEASKPSPDIFGTALDNFGLDRERTIVVGDTRWDLEAAASAGLECVAVLTGGSTRHDLEEAGAVAVYEDVADLLGRLDQSPLARLLEK